MSNQSQSNRPRGGPGGGGPVGFARGVARAKNPGVTLARLARYLLASKLQLALIGVFVVFGTVSSLLGPYFVGVAIDQYIRVGNVSGLYGLAIILLAIYLVSYASNSIQSILMARLSQRVLKQLRKELFEHLQTLSLSFFDKRTQGELMSRLTNDIDAINQALSQSLTQLISSLLSVVGILIVMFILNAWLAIGDPASISSNDICHDLHRRQNTRRIQGASEGAWQAKQHDGGDHQRSAGRVGLQ